MLRMAKVFIFITALIHIAFFCMESLWWLTPHLHQLYRHFWLRTREIATAELLGFCDLFLAIGLLISLRLLAKENFAGGIPLARYICCFMIGAAVVLYQSSPDMLYGAIAQGFPSLLALLFSLGVKKRPEEAADEIAGEQQEEQRQMDCDEEERESEKLYVPGGSLVNAIILGRREQD